MTAPIVDGIQCPECNGESRVTDSRDGIDARRRRRECYICKHRYTTYEIHAEQYDKLQTLRVDTEQFDSIIATLRAIKVQFGESNGHRKD